MKKIIIFAAFLVLVASLVSCNMIDKIDIVFVGLMGDFLGGQKDE